METVILDGLPVDFGLGPRALYFRRSLALGIAPVIGLIVCATNVEVSMISRSCLDKA